MAGALRRVLVEFVEHDAGAQTDGEERSIEHEKLRLPGRIGGDALALDDRGADIQFILETALSH